MKKKLLSIVLSVFMTLSVFAGCATPPTADMCPEHNIPLTVGYGIGNQTYLFGMCYILEERGYPGNPNFDFETEVRLLANMGVRSIRNWMHIRRGEQGMLLAPEVVNRQAADVMHDRVNTFKEHGIQVIGMSHTSFHSGTFLSGKPARDLTPGSYYLGWLYDYYLSWRTLVEEFPQIEIWQICNEMNNPHFMRDLFNNPVYTLNDMANIATDMLFYASKGILESNPAALTVIGAPTETAGLGAGPTRQFFNLVYDNIFSGSFGWYDAEGTVTASTDTDDYFMAAAWHPYMHTERFDADQFVYRNNEIYQIILNRAGKHKRVFFTEMGFNHNRWSEQEVARSITEMFEAIQDRMPYVEALHYFKIFNQAQVAWTGTISRYGLFYDPDFNRNDFCPVNATVRRTPGAPTLGALAFQEAAGGSGSLDLIKWHV